VSPHRPWSLFAGCCAAWYAGRYATWYAGRFAVPRAVVRRLWLAGAVFGGLAFFDISLGNSL
jgi:hypothetical protein